MGKMLSKVSKFATKPLGTVPFIGKKLRKTVRKTDSAVIGRGKKDTDTALSRVGFK